MPVKYKSKKKNQWKIKNEESTNSTYSFMVTWIPCREPRKNRQTCNMKCISLVPALPGDPIELLSETSKILKNIFKVLNHDPRTDMNMYQNLCLTLLINEVTSKNC